MKGIKLTLILCVSGICIAAFFLMRQGISTSAVVAHIGEQPVTVRQYSNALLRKRAEVYAYFCQKYGITDSKQFWTTGHDGEVPLEKLKQEALKYLTDINIQQSLARERGITADMSYADFLKDLSAENSRRKKALKQGTAIYGPQQYDENTYFDMKFSDMVHQLKEEIRVETNLSESETEDFYRKLVEEKRSKVKVTVHQNVYEKIGESYLR